jgi:hypothetical protein
VLFNGKMEDWLIFSFLLFAKDINKRAVLRNTIPQSCIFIFIGKSRTGIVRKLEPSFSYFKSVIKFQKNPCKVSSFMGGSI